jgi:hypothetical protein
VERRFLLTSVLSHIVLASACGGGPTQPSALSSAPPLSFTVSTPTDLIRIRESATFVATGTFADGTTRPVAAIWTTDAPAVATVDRQGTVRGVSAGRANIIASLNGDTVVKPLRVVPNYAGRWSGSLVIVSCSMGDFRTCGRSYPIGTTGTLTLAVSQDRAAVTTSLEFTYHVVTSITNFVSTRIGSVGGTILDDGRMMLDGKLQTRVSDTVLVDVSTLWNWSSAADAGADTVRGSFQELSFFFGGYAQHVGWEFGPLTRVAPP